jgi:riboflavin transporter FmnP
MVNTLRQHFTIVDKVDGFLQEFPRLVIATAWHYRPSRVKVVAFAWMIVFWFMATLWMTTCIFVCEVCILVPVFFVAACIQRFNTFVQGLSARLQFVWSIVCLPFTLTRRAIVTVVEFMDDIAQELIMRANFYRSQL